MSVLGNSLEFLNTIGLYDVVLPFLLIFTIMFGILEKSKIFGTEKIGDATLPRKNLNAMVAFCAGFFVVASAQLVGLINVFVARMSVVLVVIIMFMIMVATFHKQQDDKGLDLSKWIIPLTIFVIAASVLIFLDGVGWLGPAWIYVTGNWDSTFVGTIILFGVIIGLIVWLTHTPKKKTSES